MVELSSLDVLFLARELAQLEDAYIDKVYELEPGEFLFRTRHPERGRAALLVKPGAYACLVEEPPETPQSPTSFATLLRKHLIGIRVRRVEQHGFDRVLAFHLDERGEPLRLLVELFGKGNLVLVGSDNVIRFAQFTETYRDRTVKRGEVFKFPPSRLNPLTLGRADFDRLADGSERDAVRFLAVDVALGGDVAEEILHRAQVPKNRRARELTESEREPVWKAWNDIVHSDPTPAVAASDGNVRVESVPFGTPKFAGWTRTAAPSLSAAIDRARRLEAAAAPVARNEERDRLERQIEKQRETIEVMRKEAAEFEARGRFVYEHYEEAKRALLEAAELAETVGWSDLPKRLKAGTLPAFVQSVNPEARVLRALVGGVPVELDPAQSLEKNASRLYDEAKRVRAKMQNAAVAVAETERKLGAQDRAGPSKAVQAEARQTGRRYWFESFRWFFTSEGFLVVGGRDAASNEKVVKKHLSAGDVYFHADVHGAPSCVLKSEGRLPGEASLKEAAQFAVAYSKAFAQFGSADAFWVRPEQVSKTAPSGEFVGKGAFVIRGERNYVPRLPMEVALGLVGLTKDGRPGEPAAAKKLMGGPVSAVSKWCRPHVLVVRGDQKPAALAKELAPRLGATIDELVAALPGSTVRVQPTGGAS